MSSPRPVSCTVKLYRVVSDKACACGLRKAERCEIGRLYLKRDVIRGQIRPRRTVNSSVSDFPAQIAISMLRQTQRWAHRENTSRASREGSAVRSHLLEAEDD